MTELEKTIAERDKLNEKIEILLAERYEERDLCACIEYESSYYTPMYRKCESWHLFLRKKGDDGFRRELICDDTKIGLASRARELSEQMRKIADRIESGNAG